MKINVYLDDMRTPKSVRRIGNEDVEIGDPRWVITRTIEDTKVLLLAGIVNHMSLDHDLGPGDTGYDLVTWMESENVWPAGSIQVHSANPVGKQNMLAVLAKNNR